MSIVQYILVRGDLLLKEGWPVGAVIAQAGAQPGENEIWGFVTEWLPQF